MPSKLSMKNKKTNQKAKPNKTATIHKKWQDDAEALGGKDAKVVVFKPEAKKLILKLLNDKYVPMNITTIYKELKAVVPSPILKSCLEEMQTSSDGVCTNDNSNKDDDDDDDDDFVKSSSQGSKSKKTDEYSATVQFKLGRTTNACLYYINQSKLANEGNGLDPEARQVLQSDEQKSTDELQSISSKIETLTSATKELLSQPKNAELNDELTTRKNEADAITEKLVAARKLKGNKAQLEKCKRLIESNSAHWKKRKRMCKEFLEMMEDCTDGTISCKKCMGGTGQIEIETDEGAIKDAKAMYHSKKNNKRSKLNNVSSSMRNGEVQPSENFVGVILEGRPSIVVRVMVDEK